MASGTAARISGVVTKQTCSPLAENRLRFSRMILVLDSKVSLLSALRLAAFCSEPQLIVIDAVEAVAQFRDNYLGVDCSGSDPVERYVFQVIHLDDSQL